MFWGTPVRARSGSFQITSLRFYWEHDSASEHQTLHESGISVLCDRKLAVQDSFQLRYNEGTIVMKSVMLQRSVIRSIRSFDRGQFVNVIRMVMDSELYGAPVSLILFRS